MLNHEYAGASFAPALQAYSAYPSAIRPYLLRADTHPTLRSLFTKSGIAVLLDILSRAPVHNPSRPIKVRVDNVAERLNRSEKTVQRVLKLLQDKGWLMMSPEHDGRNWRGKFSHREFLVGDELREMIGLPLRGKIAESEMSDGEDLGDQKPVDKSLSSPEMSDGHIGVNKVFKEVALKEASVKKSESEKTERSLPQDRVQLQSELQISKGGICSLMSQAKKQGLRLQDIWLAKRATMLKAAVKEGRAYLYLKKLIEAGEDFSAIAKQQARIDTANVASKKNVGRKIYWHKKFSGANGLRVQVFDGTAEVTLNRLDGRFVPAADMDSIYEAIESGNLREIIE